MKENPWSKLRREKIQQVKELIRDMQPVKHTKLLATIDVYMGATGKTATSMIKTLQDADFIVFDGKKEEWSIKK